MNPWFSSSHAKIDVCPEDDVHTFNSIRLNSFIKFGSSLEKFDVWSKPYLSLDLETIFVHFNS